MDRTSCPQRWNSAPLERALLDCRRWRPGERLWESLSHAYWYSKISARWWLSWTIVGLGAWTGVGALVGAGAVAGHNVCGDSKSTQLDRISPLLVFCTVPCVRRGFQCLPSYGVRSPFALVISSNDFLASLIFARSRVLVNVLRQVRGNTISVKQFFFRKFFVSKLCKTDNTSWNPFFLFFKICAKIGCANDGEAL